MTGLDTETHKGRAVLIATPRRHLTFPRNFEQCLEFHLTEKEYVAWNEDYDACAILSYLEPAILERLYALSKWTIEVKIFSAGVCRKTKVSLHYVPRKFLSIRAGNGKRGRKTTIYDLAQFYNMSLERASVKFLGEHKKDPGIDWKDLKRVLKQGGKRARKIIDYCHDDASKVERLARLTTDKFSKIGVVFERPVSCASLSYRYFREDLKFQIPQSVNRQARESFRGGMIECLMAGYFREAFYIDVRSAYPFAISQLEEMPDSFLPIENGKLHPSVLECGYASIDCFIRIPRDLKKGWIPYFASGDAMLLYPVGGWRTWVDLTSYRKLNELGMVQKIFGGVQAIGLSDHRPFKKEVEYLYRQRSKGEDLKWSVKIILNSLYGKFAETRKFRIPESLEELLDLGNVRLDWNCCERFLPHTNFFLAGEITSRTRWKLIEEIAPDDVIFYATDGVFLKRKPKHLKFGVRLGEWSEPERVTDLVVVGSGVYTYKTDDKETVTRFRGFDSSIKLYELLDRSRHTIPIEIQRNQKLGQTVINQRWDRFNVIHMEERELNVNFDHKRVWERKWTARELLHRSFQSLPWQVFDGC